MEKTKVQVQWMHEFSQKILGNAAFLTPKDFSFQIQKEQILFKYKQQELQRINLNAINKIEVTKEEHKRWIITCGKQNDEILLPMDAEIEGHTELMDTIVAFPNFDALAFIEFESSEEFTNRILVFVK